MYDAGIGESSHGIRFHSTSILTVPERFHYRKIRCDGADACSKCTAVGAECEYNPVTKYVLHTILLCYRADAIRYREENQAAREKKAQAKANRPKVMRLPAVLSYSDAKKTQKKKKPVKMLETPEGKLDFSDMSLGQVDNQIASVQNAAHSPVPSVQSVETYYEHEDLNSASESTSSHFGYFSSSTTSLQSSIYDSTYSRDAMSGYPSMDLVQTSPQPGILESIISPGYQFYAGDYQTPAFIPPSDIKQPTYAQPIYQPQGLCLYLPGQETYQIEHTSPQAATMPNMPNHHSYSNASPPIYQGPIDWNSRPLAPYQSTNVPQQMHGSRSRSHSDLYIDTQTVRLDQICSAAI